MTKTFLVAGSTWVAEVNIENAEALPPNTLKIEAMTRAVEAHFGKRDDIEITRHEPIVIPEDKRETDELHTALVDLLSEELEPGCGIGMMLCIMDNQDPATYKSGEDHEWYMSSKVVLENVGMPELVKRFNEKYPDKKV